MLKRTSKLFCQSKVYSYSIGTGKLFRTSDLPTIVEFFLMFHKDKPVDWLLDHILWVKVCNPDKDQVVHRYYCSNTWD